MSGLGVELITRLTQPSDNSDKLYRRPLEICGQALEISWKRLIVTGHARRSCPFALTPRRQSGGWVSAARKFYLKSSKPLVGNHDSVILMSNIQMGALILTTTRVQTWRLPRDTPKFRHRWVLYTIFEIHM